MAIFVRKKKGTIEALLEKKQKADLKQWKEGEARKKKLVTIKRKTEIAEAKTKLTKARTKLARAKAKRRTVLGLPIKKVRQTRVLSRKSRIRLV